MKITLSKPLALNQLYATNKWGAKYLTAKGQSWKDEVMWKLKREKLENWAVPLALEYHLYTCRHQDIDSVLKVMLDTLQEAGVIADDYWIWELRGYKHKCKIADERIELEIGVVK